MYEFYVLFPNEENGDYTESKVSNSVLALAFATAGFQVTMVDTETNKPYILSVQAIQTDE